MAKDEDEKKGESGESPEAPDPPLTTQEFTDALNKLTDRARDAGVRTAKVMVAAGAMELLKVLDGVLEGLDAPEKPKGKGKKKAPRA